MSIVQITDKNGTREIDLSPVEKYMELVRQSFGGKYPTMSGHNPMELFSLAKSMTAEQLRYLVSHLESTLREKVRENRYLHTKDGLKTTCKVRRIVKLMDKQGLDIWPDNNEYRE